MRRTRKAGLLIERLILGGFVLAALPVIGGTSHPAVIATNPKDHAGETKLGFAVRFRGVTASTRLSTLTALPGERVSLEIVNRSAGSGYAAHSAFGKLVPLGNERWEWTAPDAPGLYSINMTAPDRSDSVTVQAFVLVPYDHLQGEYLNGYRIGRYPEKPLRGLAAYRPPAGFVEVTRANENMLVSPHFQLKQFLCKQPSGYPKYVVLNERLLFALEDVLSLVNKAGHRATTFHVMSGYRTPAYNRSLGNVSFSQHQWGSAADIFIDESGDGRMDDLNGDGRSDIRDSEVLYRLIDSAAGRRELQGLVGGLGKYRPTAAHGPFVHVDVREGTARWARS
jgi:hypothetical protein